MYQLPNIDTKLPITTNRKSNRNTMATKNEIKPIVLTVVIHIYNNQEALNLQIQHWEDWGFISGLELIFIDDCSSPALKLNRVPNWVRKIKICDDIPWNQPGGKNLGASLALGSWLLFLDADQVFTKNDIYSLIQELPQFKHQTLYRFERRCAKTQKSLVVHQNCHLISKFDYDNFGGYDEDFAGNYGHEDAYFERLWKFKGGNIIVLTKPYLSDFSEMATSGLNRSQRENKLLRRRKMRYWHVINNPVGKFILKSKFIHDLLITTKILVNGEPSEQIRFQWQEL